MHTFRIHTADDEVRAETLRKCEPRLTQLAAVVRERMAPAELWVFGSRARGDGHPDSDWDLLFVFNDQHAEIAADDRKLWRLARDTGLVTDVVAVTAADAYASRNVANTLMYAVSREGIRVA